MVTIYVALNNEFANRQVGPVILGPPAFVMSRRSRMRCSLAIIAAQLGCLLASG